MDQVDVTLASDKGKDRLGILAIPFLAARFGQHSVSEYVVDHLEVSQN